jgi:hypothetical protein
MKMRRLSFERESFNSGDANATKFAELAMPDALVGMTWDDAHAERTAYIGYLAGERIVEYLSLDPRTPMWLAVGERRKPPTISATHSIPRWPKPWARALPMASP